MFFQKIAWANKKQLFLNETILLCLHKEMEAEIRKSTEAEIMKSLEDAAVLKQSDLQGVKEPYNRLPSQLWISHNPTVQSEKVQVLRKNRKLLGRERMSSDDVQLYKDFE